MPHAVLNSPISVGGFSYTGISTFFVLDICVVTLLEESRRSRRPTTKVSWVSAYRKNDKRREFSQMEIYWEWSINVLNATGVRNASRLLCLQAMSRVICVCSEWRRGTWAISLNKTSMFPSSSRRCSPQVLRAAPFFSRTYFKMRACNISRTHRE